MMIKIYLDQCAYNRPFDNQDNIKNRLETEKFISLIKSDNFDYTEWHKNLWKDKSIEEIHSMATIYEKKRLK